MFGRATIFLATVLAASTACAQSAPSTTATPPPAPAYVKPAPVGKLVDIGGRRLDIRCKGKPVGPVVMFENGLTQYDAHA